MSMISEQVSGSDYRQGTEVSMISELGMGSIEWLQASCFGS
jgi:hypothetical protein